MLLDYYALLARLHRELRPGTYLEIGVHEGHSLSLVQPGTHAIGIDPALPDCLKLEPPPQAELHAVTSDEFFADADPAELRIDLAFIDGLHLFEQALRDFLNVERHAAPGATVLIHDCLPIDEVTSARERTTVVWSGDVWKLIPCLRDQRPELDVAIVDVPPTGLGVVTNLDPSSALLADRYDELVDRYLALPWTRTRPTATW